MKTCMKCSTENDDKNVVCTNCGALLEQPKSKYSFYNKPIIKKEKEEENDNKLDDNLLSKEFATQSVEDVVDKVKGFGRKVIDKFETVGAMVGGSTSIMGIGGGSDDGAASMYIVLKDAYAKESGKISSELS